MVHKFHLNVAMKCAIVTGIQEPSEATWMLATSLWRRNKNKTNQILTTLDGATYKGSIERGYAMSPNRSVSSSIVHPARLGRLMSWVVVALAFWVLTPEMAQAQTVLPNTINLPPSSLASPSVPPSASFSDMKRADLAVGNEVAHEVEVVPMAIPGVVPESAPQIAALSNAEVRATELRGLLPHQFDRHYFGLEAMQTGGAFAVTLVVEPATALAADAVNFVVLTDDGLKQFLAGVDPLVVKTAIGSPLLFDQIGNRLTALVPGNHSTGYTVIVYNNSKMPVSYALQVQGGLLRDDAGQTFSAILVNASEVESTATDSRIIDMAELDIAGALQGYGGSIKEVSPEIVLTPSKTPTSMLLPEPVRARRVSGVLMNAQDRHYLNLAADTGEGDITLTLRYRGVGDVPAQLNFWVMTQDGVRHLIQGALAQELNLATGLPVVGEEGVYVARLRIAQNMLYTVVLFNDGQSEADYALSVQGGILVDRYAQTREAQAAAMELMALGGK
jgi:hypothetical protein